MASELRRLESEGHLDALRTLLRDANTELWLSAAKPRDGMEELIGIVRGSGLDDTGVLATRSRFTVTLPTGDVREVYMPDHICPACLNDAGNVLDACARVCRHCDYRW